MHLVTMCEMLIFRCVRERSTFSDGLTLCTATSRRFPFAPAQTRVGSALPRRDSDREATLIEDAC